MSTPGLFRRLLCDNGFHDTKTAKPLGPGALEITGKKNHAPYVLPGPFDVFECACGTRFTTGLSEQKAAS